MKIALHGRKFDPDYRLFMAQLVEELSAFDVSLCIYEPLLSFMQNELHISLPMAHSFSSTEKLPNDTHCLINIGGDGTFLDSMSLIHDSGIPVVGVNLGRLGFLANVSFENITESIEAILTGKYTIEDRSILQIQADILPNDIYPYALNEVGIQHHTPSMISISVKINNEKLPTYWSDGLLVATPTGSTAYALSVGGPIMTPDAKNFIIAPIAPHNLNVRPMVIPDTAVLEISVFARKDNAFLTFDRQELEVPSGTKLTVKKAPFSLRFIRLNGNSFFTTLHEKLAWGIDKRN